MKKFLILFAVIFAISVLTAGCTGGYIGADEARNIALKSAGVSEGDVIGFDVDLEKEAGQTFYDVSFDAKGYEYDYEIDAGTGDILRSFRELDDDTRLPTPTVSDDTAASPLPQENTEAVTEPQPETEPQTDTQPETAEPEPQAEAMPENSVTAASDNAPAPASAPAAPVQSSGYIGRDAAADIALKHAGYTAEEVYSLESELDTERGVVVYDVGFDVEGYDYDYEIDAVSGDILRSDKERDNDAPKTKRTEDTSLTSSITAETAKQTALNHAGIAEADAKKMETGLDYDHGKAVYEVSFESGGYEYEYEIDAATGEILRSEKERD